MMNSHGKDLKNQVLVEFAEPSTGSITAAGAGDNTQVTGNAIDLEGLSSRPASVLFAIPARAVLDEDETCIITGLIEKSADNSNWETLLASATLLTLTGGAGGSTEEGVALMGADLIESDCRYVRCKFTPDLSRGGTDTMVVGAAVAVFGGLSDAP